ncbi:MAG: hypothetical protein J6Z42_05990 [Lachnospiraceae bacterium]|nr:hypothetical protein [Lachnospiraceae bacterium]
MAELKVRTFVEYRGKKSDVKAAAARAHKDAVKKCKAEPGDIKIYIKPEDGKAYYAAEPGKVKGDVNL